MIHLLSADGPHRTVAALDVLAVIVLAVCAWLIWRLAVRHLDMFRLDRAAVRDLTAAPALPAQDDGAIPEAQVVRTPLASARKAIGR
jgi:hypothetical protein